MTDFLGLFVLVQNHYPYSCLAILAVIKSTVILSAAWVACALLKNQSASVRVWVWRIAFLALALLAVFIFFPYRTWFVQWKIKVPIGQTVYQKYSALDGGVLFRSQDEMFQAQQDRYEATYRNKPEPPPWEMEKNMRTSEDMRSPVGNGVEASILPLWLGIAGLFLAIIIIRERKRARASENKWWRWGIAFISCLWWWNPFVWIVRRCLGGEEERAAAELTVPTNRSTFGFFSATTVAVLSVFFLALISCRLTNWDSSREKWSQKALPRTKISESQQVQLKTIYAALEKRQTAMRYLHFKSETMKSRKDLTTGRVIQAAQPGKTEVWVDEWVKKYKVIYQPRVWPGDKANPFPTSNGSEVNDGKNWYKLDVAGTPVGPAQAVTWRNRFELENHLAIWGETELLSTIHILQINRWVQFENVKITVEEKEWNGNRIWEVCISRLMGIPEGGGVSVAWGAHNYYLDPQKDFSIVLYAGEASYRSGWTPSEDTIWTALEMGQTRAGQYYPKRYREETRSTISGDKNSHELMTTETTITFLKVLPAYRWD